jgi:Outer membrane protein beta-barrel domain
MKYILNILIFFTVCNLFSQEKPNFEAVDSLYREDQFYIGISYNALQDRPIGISQKKFTPSFSLGFLRDMPINKKRTIAIAAGLGYAINNFNENLLISENSGSISYNNINTSYDRNKLILHYVELPIEFRWRTSTPESHKFYRIYAGFKCSYLVYDRSKYIDANATIKVTGNPDFNKLQYGTYIAFGNNSLTFHIYYGLNPIFKSGMINGKPIETKTLNFGLMFYIL